MCVGKGQQLKHHIITPICWHKPDHGWFKLNSDGASQGNPDKTGGGGLIRDQHRNWIKGYMRKIGVASSFIAECWALRDGLLLAVQLGIQHIVELDAITVVNLVSTNSTSNRSYPPLLNDCRYILGQFHRFKVIHTFREVNRWVDYLARAGCSLAEDFVVLDLPSNDVLCNMLSTDAAGLYSLRRTATTSPFMAS